MDRISRIGRLRWQGAALVLLVGLGTALGGMLTTRAAAGIGCDLYAATSGSDRASGSVSAPFQTAQHLVDSLAPGQTGCLLGGTFTGGVRIARGGAPGSPITLTAAPGAAATVVGRFYVVDSANDVVISNLYLDGTNDVDLPSPIVDGDRVMFTNDDVTNHNTDICFVLGATDTYGFAVGVVIQNSRIHNCGKLPATNHEHGIYVEAARNTLIQNNAIYDNADRGVQLYPDAQGTVVQNNAIDGNGEGVLFSGNSDSASSNNVVRANVVADSTIRTNIESWWGGAVGSANLADSNCVWNGKNGNLGNQVGFVATRTVVADPGFVDRAARDFSLKPGSPCAGMGLTSPVGVLATGSTSTTGSDNHPARRRPH